MGTSQVEEEKRVEGSRGRHFFPPDMPGQFRLLVGGSLLTSTGIAIAYPFLTLYLNSHLGVPMDRIGLAFIGSALGALVAQTLAGPIADRFGRKPVMLVGLFAQSCVCIGYTQAATFEQFALLMTFSGFFGSFFQPASSAMVVDLVGVERRAEAFGLMRIATNLGFVIGPSLGGFLAVRSYTALFAATATALMLYMVILLFFARETLPASGSRIRFQGWSGGYGRLLTDRPFMMLIVASLLTTVAYAQLSTTLPVYLKQQVGIAESGYGLLMALNGGLVVLLQLPTSRLVQHRDRAFMLSAGALCYAIGIGAMGWWRELPMFALSMAVVTIGEMMIAPVASAEVADLAPDHMRARYMAMFGLTWSIGYGVGPTLGGAVMVHLGAHWVWPAIFVVGCMAAAAYLPLHWAGRGERDGVGSKGK
jgi:MFS family permease